MNRQLSHESRSKKGKIQKKQRQKVFGDRAVYIVAKYPSVELY